MTEEHRPIRSRAFDPHNQRQGNLIAIDQGGRLKGAGLLSNPGFGSQKDRPLGFFLTYKDPRQADVIDNHAVRQVADIERDSVVETEPLDAELDCGRASRG
jgi:hypothetical protein